MAKRALDTDIEIGRPDQAAKAGQGQEPDRAWRGLRHHRQNLLTCGQFNALRMP